jgi:glycosyltransferase involved in cell wall biosynthesis
MNKSILLSIIIPVYNCEKYIHACLEVLIKNMERYSGEIEIIVINDGSDDNTYKIIESYGLYSYIKIFHKTNGGVSSARNMGLKNAHGKYIAFIDGDDWISDDYFIVLFDHIRENYDAIIFNVYRHTPVGKFTVKTDENKKLTLEDKFINCAVIMNSVCNKVFKSDIIKKNKICFDESVSASEDLLFVFKFLVKSPKLLFLDDVLYNYRLNYDSVTQNQNEKHLLDSQRVIREIKNFLLKENIMGFSRYLEYQKLFVKKPYLTDIKYFNPKKWMETFPEVNDKALSFSRTILDRLIYIFILWRMPLITYCISFFWYYIKVSAKGLLHVIECLRYKNIKRHSL